MLHVLAAAIAVLLMTEAGARLVIARAAYVDPWRGTFAAGHEEALEQLGAQGGVDLVVYGSSVVGAGLDPTRIQAQLPAVGSSYNVWLAGANMENLHLVGREMVLPSLRPRWLVIGVSSRELNDNGLPQRARHQIMRRSPAGLDHFGASDPLLQLQQWMSRYSSFVAHRDLLRNPSRVLEALRGWRLEEEVTLAPSGMETDRLEAELELRPEHEAQERAALAGFDIGGNQMDALARLILEARASGAEVLLVAMPVLEDVYAPLHPGGMEDVRRYRRHVSELAAELDVPLLRAYEHPWGPEEYADHNHLNRRGVDRISDLVADALRGMTDD